MVSTSNICYICFAGHHVHRSINVMLKYAKRLVLGPLPISYIRTRLGSSLGGKYQGWIELRSQPTSSQCQSYSKIL